jgi:ribosomal protein S18 acetylase RimI-like enzyme
MAIEFVALSEFGLAKSAVLLATAFADYLVKIQPTEAMLWSLARSDSVSFADSRVALLEGKPVGAGLVARRGWTSRLAGMALLPEARRRGVGRALVEQLLAEATARGDRAYVLEVIEQNVAAVKLYEAARFQRVRRLVGFELKSVAAREATEGLREVDLRAVGAALVRESVMNWPWQLSGETIAQLTPPSAGYELDGAWVALTPVANAVVIRAMVVEGNAAREVRASRLLHAVLARYRPAECRISTVWPEELGEWFQLAGFVRTDLSQWQMTRALNLESVVAGTKAAGDGLR